MCVFACFFLNFFQLYSIKIDCNWLCLLCSFALCVYVFFRSTWTRFSSMMLHKFLYIIQAWILCVSLKLVVAFFVSSFLKSKYLEAATTKMPIFRIYMRQINELQICIWIAYRWVALSNHNKINRRNKSLLTEIQ